MKVIAINGSPRKSWNTATLLTKALEGAVSAGMEAELVHLYNLDFKGCVSCFACKTLGGPSYGKCGYKDDMTPVLERIAEADALLLGSPIYFGSVTGEMHSFLERLLFQYFTLTNPLGTLFKRTMKNAFIYTMGITEEQTKEYGYKYIFKSNEFYLRMAFGHAESFYSYDTCQFNDYSIVLADRYDPAHKAKRRLEAFPRDCERASELGIRLASSAV